MSFISSVLKSFLTLGRRFDLWVVLASFFLLVLSFLILNSISPEIFPNYYFYVLASFLFFFIFSLLDFSLLVSFSPIAYVFSLVFLLLPLLFGQITRGAVRWLEFGVFSIQPAEIVRPFLVLFWAHLLSVKPISLKRFLFSFISFVVPAFLVLIQPSLGVFVITSVSFLGVLIASSFDKRKLLFGIVLLILVVPILYDFLAPYQKQRIITFLNPQSDPYGAGYNSIQSMIAIGSGRFLGRGLGQGIQTQLQFLPERRTDFVFASIAEEMGFVGVLLLVIFYSVLFLRIIHIISLIKIETGRLYLSGFLLGLLFQVFVHMGMNLGIMPVTGVPLPLVSSGGSSLLATMIFLGMVNSVTRTFAKNSVLFL